MYVNTDLYSTFPWKGDTFNALMSLMSGKEMCITAGNDIQNLQQMQSSYNLTKTIIMSVLRQYFIRSLMTMT